MNISKSPLIQPTEEVIRQSQINKNFDNITPLSYYINIERREDRFLQFQKNYPHTFQGVQPPIRWPAVDGKSESVKPPEGWRSGQNAWGCYLSHYGILNFAHSLNLHEVCIFEDDACFHDHFSDLYGHFRDRVEATVGDEWDILYLGGHHIWKEWGKPVRVRKGLVKGTNVNLCTAYIISQRGLQRILALCSDFRDWQHNHHIDFQLGNLTYRGLIEVYCPEDALVGQDESNSDILNKFRRRRWGNFNRIDTFSEQDPHNPDPNPEAVFNANDRARLRAEQARIKRRANRPSPSDLQQPNAPRP